MRSNPVIVKCRNPVLNHVARCIQYGCRQPSACIPRIVGKNKQS